MNKKYDIDIELLKEMMAVGFTKFECAKILEIPVDALMYYRNVNKLGNFHRKPKIAKIEDYENVRNLYFTQRKSVNDISLELNIVQPRVSQLVRYLRKEIKLEENKRKWLEEKGIVNVVVKN